MSSPLITKIRYIDPSKSTYSSHKSNHIVYIATNKDEPNPYRKDGKKRVLDDEEEVYTFKKDKDHQSNYAKYMIKDDKEELESGLFTYYGEADLDKATADVENHNNTVYTAIISLKEDEAKKLGYSNPEKWIEDIQKNMSHLLKKTFGFSYENTTWYGAVHMKEGHPHVHIMFYENSRTKSKNTFSKAELKDFRRNIASVLYADRRKELFKEKDILRSKLKEVTGKSIKEIMKDGLTNPEKSEIKKFTSRLKANDSPILEGGPILRKEMKLKLSDIIMDNQDKIKKDSNLRYGYGTEKEKELTNQIIDILLETMLKDQKKRLYEIKKEIYEEYSILDLNDKNRIMKEVEGDLRENIQNIIYRNLKQIGRYNPYKVIEYKFKNATKDINLSTLSNKEPFTFKEKIALSKLIWNLNEHGNPVDEDILPEDLRTFYLKYSEDFKLQKLLERDIHIYPVELEILDDLNIGFNPYINFYEYYSTSKNRGIVDNIAYQTADKNYKVLNTRYKLLQSLNSEVRRKTIEKEIRAKYAPNIANQIIEKHFRDSAVKIALDKNKIKIKP